MRKTFLLLLAAFCSIATTLAQSSNAALKGVVVNKHTKQPIADAQVFLANQNMTTTTNTKGECSSVV